jgi:hypothetical protein
MIGGGIAALVGSIFGPFIGLAVLIGSLRPLAHKAQEVKEALENTGTDEQSSGGDIEESKI